MENIKILEKKLAGKTNDDLDKLKVINQLAQIYVNSNPEKSLEYYRNALELSRKIQNTEKIINSFLNIGEIYKNRRDFEKAWKYLQQGMNDANKGN